MLGPSPSSQTTSQSIKLKNNHIHKYKVKNHLLFLGFYLKKSFYLRIMIRIKVSR